MRASGPGGIGAPTGPGWSRGPGRGPPWPGPGGLLGYCFNGLCSTISSCFYTLCCCRLLQDCFGGPSGPPAPYAPLGPPGPPPSVAFGPPPEPFEPAGPAAGPPGPPRLW